MTDLQKLERENDEALLVFWQTLEVLRECEHELAATREALAVQVAQHAHNDAEASMVKARKTYLEAKVKKGSFIPDEDL